MSDFYRFNSTDVDKKLEAVSFQRSGETILTLRTLGSALVPVLDQVDADTLYVGHALPGTLTSSPAWRVRKLLTSGTVTQMLTANSDAFTSIWDNRAALSFS